VSRVRRLEGVAMTVPIDGGGVVPSTAIAAHHANLTGSAESFLDTASAAVVAFASVNMSAFGDR